MTVKKFILLYFCPNIKKKTPFKNLRSKINDNSGVKSVNSIRGGVPLSTSQSNYKVNIPIASSQNYINTTNQNSVKSFKYYINDDST
jgi:hypothetical protein